MAGDLRRRGRENTIIAARRGVTRVSEADRPALEGQG
jgi:hypothetical protein